MCPTFGKYSLTAMEAFTERTIPELQNEYERVMKEYAAVAEAVNSPSARKRKQEVWSCLTFDVVKDYLATNSTKPASRYGLIPQATRGVEPGIYVYQIIHSTKFLKDKGRLGMIISDSWLQADHGVRFGKFLLDN